MKGSEAEGPATKEPEQKTIPWEVRECRCRELFKAPYWSDRTRCPACENKGARHAD